MSTFQFFSFIAHCEKEVEGQGARIIRYGFAGGRKSAARGFGLHGSAARLYRRRIGWSGRPRAAL